MKISEIEQLLKDVKDGRMEAYYFSFDRTGVSVIDKILSRVCEAGKAYHHTEGWNEESGYSEGASLVFRIQEAASQASQIISSLLSEVKRLEREKEAYRTVAIVHNDHKGQPCNCENDVDEEFKRLMEELK